jgi:hypothetical protein
MPLMIHWRTTWAPELFLEPRGDSPFATFKALPSVRPQQDLPLFSLWAHGDKLPIGQFAASRFSSLSAALTV